MSDGGKERALSRVGSPHDLETLRESIIKSRDVDRPCIAVSGGTGCLALGAEGVIAISGSRPYFDPLQIPWSRLGSRRRGGSSDDPPPKPKFGFYLPVREGAYLKQRLLRRQKITVHARYTYSMC